MYKNFINKYKFKSNLFLCLFLGAVLSGYYIYVQSRSGPAAPGDFFVFMEPPGALSPGTLSRPMTAKSRRKSAAPTPRSRGYPTHVARSPGAHGSRQLLRCPRKATKPCGSVHSFHLGETIEDVDHLIWLLYCSLYSRLTGHTE